LELAISRGETEYVHYDEKKDLYYCEALVNVGWADYIRKDLHKSSELLPEKKDTERRKGLAIAPTSCMMTRSRHRRLPKNNKDK